MTTQTTSSKELANKKEETPQAETPIEATPKKEGKLAKVVKATDEVKGMNPNTRPTFTEVEGIITVEGTEDLFQIDGYDESQRYEPNTFGRLYAQRTMLYALYGSRTTCVDAIDISSVFGVPLSVAELMYKDIDVHLKVLDSTSEDTQPRAVLSVIQALKDKGYSESNIRAFCSFQKGRFDNIFRPSFSTKVYSAQFNETKDLRITILFNKESDKQAFVKRFENVNDILLSWEKQKNSLDATKYAKLSDYVTAMSAHNNAHSSKVELIERKQTKVQMSEDMI